LVFLIFHFSQIAKSIFGDILSTVIIIDGHNLLWSIQKSSEDFESITYVQLCRMIGAYLRQIDEFGCVVFDGIGPPDKEIFDDMGKLEVLFSGRSEDADQVIEDKITANTAPRRLVVVSSDRRLRAAARRRKATSLKTEVFWDRVLLEAGRKRRPREPRAKREGISESETEQWLKRFGLDED
jgi:predicted RNA-binding protein with PIN domain